MKESAPSILLADRRELFMVRKGLLLFGLCALSSLSAQAQDEDKVELFGGYSYMRFHSTNLNGWEVAGQYKFLDWLGGVADVDGHYGSFSGIVHVSLRTANLTAFQRVAIRSLAAGRSS